MRGKSGWEAESAKRINTPSAKMTIATDQKLTALKRKRTGIEARATARPMLVINQAEEQVWDDAERAEDADFDGSRVQHRDDQNLEGDAGYRAPECADRSSTPEEDECRRAKHFGLAVGGGGVGRNHLVAHAFSLSGAPLGPAGSG